MIQKIEANNRYLAFHGWLKSFHLFSFADYYDPENLNFGNLRVFNDDWIDAQSGFGDHTHRNMEIITIVNEGEITHKDSMGNNGAIRAGEVQVMSAGTAVTHAELNLSDKPVQLYQIWILPSEMETKPRYDQKDFTQISNQNTLLPVASGFGHKEALEIRTQAAIFSSTLLEGKELNYELATGRGAFIYVTQGSLQVNGETFNDFDQARISDEAKLEIKAIKPTKFILIEVTL